MEISPGLRSVSCAPDIYNQTLYNHEEPDGRHVTPRHRTTSRPTSADRAHTTYSVQGSIPEHYQRA